MSVWIAERSVTEKDLPTRPRGTCWVEVVKYGNPVKKKTISIVIMHLKKRIYLVSEKSTIEFLPPVPSIAAPSWLPQQGAVSKVGDFTVHGLVIDSVPSVRNDESQLTQKSFHTFVDECTKFVNNTLKFNEQLGSFKLLGSVFYYSDAVVKVGYMIRKDAKSRNEVIHPIYEIESLISYDTVTFKGIVECYLRSFDQSKNFEGGLTNGPKGWRKTNAYIYAKLDEKIGKTKVGQK